MHASRTVRTQNVGGKVIIDNRIVSPYVIFRHRDSQRWDGRKKLCLINDAAIIVRKINYACEQKEEYIRRQAPQNYHPGRTIVCD